MGRSSTIKSIAFGLLASSVISSSAVAGGFDRGGVNIDQLFDNNRFSADAQITFVSPRRDQVNVRRSTNAAASSVVTAAILSVGGTPADAATDAAIDAFIAANPGPVGDSVSDAVASTDLLTGSSIATDSEFYVPRFGYKQNLGENFDCLFSYSEPFGADNNDGSFNALSASSVQFFIDTEDYGATCSLGFSGGETRFGGSTFKIIGGVSYQELDGFLSRQSFLDFFNAGVADLTADPVLAGVITAGAAAGGVPFPVVEVTNTAGLGTFTVGGDAVGWRAGLAYEIPEIALRLLAIYHSSYDYDLSGIQDNTGFGVSSTSPNARVPISLTTEIPQAVEVKLQTGIAEGTLAFANFKWQDWSQLQTIPIVGGVTATVSAAGVASVPTTLAFEPLYRDGYTITGGIGRVFTEKLSGLASLTWDRGTSTTNGSQADSWTLSGGISYKENEHIEIRLGGAVGILEGGFSSGLGTTDPANLVTYDFGEDLLLAASGGVKLKF